jgi:hypothetical protein
VGEKLGDRGWESLIPAVRHRGSLYPRHFALLFFHFDIRGHYAQFTFGCVVPPRIASMSFFCRCFSIQRPKFPLLFVLWVIAMALRRRELTFWAPVWQPPQLLTPFEARPWPWLLLFKCSLFLFLGSGRVNISFFIERLLVAKGGRLCSDHFCFHLPSWWCVIFFSLLVRCSSKTLILLLDSNLSLLRSPSYRH